MSFKIAHLSDLHLGYRATRHINPQGINLRAADGYLAFASCVDQIIEEECNVAVVCGDIFHSSHPDVRSIVFAQNQFRKLADAGVKVYALGGNHDISDRIEDLSAAKVVDDPHRGIYSSAEPYVHYEISDGIHLHMVSHHMYSAQAETFKQIQPIDSEINIFSTHGSCIDPLLKIKLKAEQSPREIVIPDFLLADKGWSYTLLGHIHERGWIGSKDNLTDTSKRKVYYNGSIIRRGFADKDVPLGRGWTLWEVNDAGVFTATTKSVAQRPQLDFDPIEATGLTSGEITDLIVSNLKESNESGEFDARIAPILRQKILDITPTKYASLNWSIINDHSQHALQWAIAQQLSSPNVSVNSGTENSAGDNHSEGEVKSESSGDIVQVYNQWVKGASSIAESEDHIKVRVTEQSRNFIKLAQEASFEE